MSQLMASSGVDADDERDALGIYPHVYYLCVVTNNGDVPLTNITISDPGLKYIGSRDILKVGESVEAELGYYCVLTVPTSNTATATGEYMGIIYDDTDMAHFFVQQP